MKQQEKIVISASRRIDMVGTGPDHLAKILDQKCPPDQVHTLVIWTKDASNLFGHKPLFDAVRKYQQLFVHYTVTGMGGSILEPRVPLPHQALQWLPRLIELTGDPRRIRFRFDPIVNLRLANGAVYSNIDWFEKFAPLVQQLGITDVSISWMATYRKVVARLRRVGIVPVEMTLEFWQEQYQRVREVADRYHLVLHGCCVPGMPRSRCIDGELLMALHPNREPCSLRKAKGQRSDCGCTESFDIGWYFHCYHGCRYCYANPEPISLTNAETELKEF
ncbi:MAG: DUF1848 domain-containing protein [candidate division KSB1 bacterium]|nr:DUF1848 domain-containing protein [candidate division KSB1 bacterium]MDZ7334197.1 DUF1848 domain-containing protein [candidate division KSB1 bacterium]MDZ7357474.1 DUF1848 domain-containing protein [candidate division KSB1 bacterium]MDZ7400890.1 DUF1848 domain-containing protein [candidate division KSB1 bacterium]